MNEELVLKINQIINETRAKLLSSETIHQDKFITLVKEVYRLPNNKIRSRDRIIRKNNKEAVLIIAKTHDDKYLIVIQNRINGITSVEFPSGYIEENESIEIAANRELEEETGYISNDIYVLDNYYTQLGIDSGIVNIVLANNCVKVSEQKLDDSEYINYMEVTFEELKELIRLNYIKSVGNKLAFYELLNIEEKVNIKKKQKLHF